MESNIIERFKQFILDNESEKNSLELFYEFVRIDEINKAKKVLNDAGYFGITWTLNDIIGRANSKGFEINEELAKKIADKIESSHDGENGITWFTIDSYIETYC